MAKRAWFHAEVDYSDVNRAIGDIAKYSGKTVLRIEEAVSLSVKAISKRARQNAPAQSGLLRKNVRSKIVLKGGVRSDMEGWSYVRGGRKGAPHAHLIELGVKPVTINAKKDPSTGRFVKLRLPDNNFTVGPIKIPARPGKPFLKDAYEEEKTQIIKRIQLAIDPKKTISS